MENDQQGNLQLRSHDILAPAAVLSVFIDLASSQTISVKSKSIFFNLLGERQTLHLENGKSTRNTVLDLMVDKMKQYNQELTLQEWVDVWCGNTIREYWTHENGAGALVSRAFSSLVNKVADISLLYVLSRLGGIKESNNTRSGVFRFNRSKTTASSW